MQLTVVGGFGLGVSFFVDRAPDAGETLSVTAVGTAAHGTVTLVGGVVRYTPAADYFGADLFTYTLSDGNGGAATGSVALTVTPVNDNPTANPDSLTVAEDAAATAVPVLLNDSFAPDVGETLVVTAVGTASHGTVALVAGVVRYAPAADYNGPDSFAYTIGDGNGGTATGTASVTVTPVNDPPTAVPDTVTLDEDAGATAVDVLANDTTDAGETLTITAVTQPSNGTAAISGGRIVYSPRAGFHGTDSFGYTITDGNGGTASALVTVSVTAPLPTPVDVVAVGADVGSRVRVVRTDRQEILADFEAFPGFQGGVTVAMGDFTGDGVPDLAVGAGPGGGPVVKLYDGALLSRGPDAALITTFNAFLPSLRGGVTVAAGDVNGDGRADLVVGAGPGGGPHVKVVSATELKNLDGDGLPRNLLASFFAYAAGFTGGVRVAAGDVTGDGRADVVTGAGIGGTPHVKIYDGTSFAEINSFYAYAARFAGGKSVPGVRGHGCEGEWRRCKACRKNGGGDQRGGDMTWHDVGSVAASRPGVESARMLACWIRKEVCSRRSPKA